MVETKYEKINSQYIRRWEKYDQMYKPDLQQEKGHINNILALSDSVMQKVIDESGIGWDLENFKQTYQDRKDEIDYLLDLYNNSTTPEEIDFIDE